MTTSEPLDLLPSRADAGGHNRRSVKWVSCVIRPEKLEETVESLNKLGLVGGMTVTDVRGCGRQKGQVEHYRGEAFTVRLLPKVRVELAVPDDDLAEVMEVVRRASSTGRIGDGKMFVTDVVDAMRVRTRERGLSAL